MSFRTSAGGAASLDRASSSTTGSPGITQCTCSPFGSRSTAAPSAGAPARRGASHWGSPGDLPVIWDQLFVALVPAMREKYQTLPSCHEKRFQPFIDRANAAPALPDCAGDDGEDDALFDAPPLWQEARAATARATMEVRMGANIAPQSGSRCAPVVDAAVRCAGAQDRVVEVQDGGAAAADRGAESQDRVVDAQDRVVAAAYRGGRTQGRVVEVRDRVVDAQARAPASRVPVRRISGDFSGMDRA